jgi:hypothetical protein
VSDPLLIKSDSQAIELLTRREELFVEYLHLTDVIEEVNERVYLLTCEIEGINLAFLNAVEKAKLSERVLKTLRNVLNDGRMPRVPAPPEEEEEMPA